MGCRTFSKEPIKDRLERFYIPEPNSGCWLWTAQKTKAGYGRYKFERMALSAHRVSYYAHVGPIPKGLLVRHRCDTPLCVNPDHLLLGTHADNMMDIAKRGRRLGERNPPSKLTQAKVHEIRELRLTLTQKQIAIIFGVSQSTIGAVLRGENWRHV